MRQDGADMAGMAFSGGGLDRAAQLRGDADALAALQAGGQVLALWRGRVLAGDDGLRWLRPGDAALRGAGASLFLGLGPDGIGRFAADLSAVLDLPAAPGGPFDPGTVAHPDLAADTGIAFADLRSRMLQMSALDAECAATARALAEWHRTHGFCASCGAASDLAQAGWQRRCAACGTSHFPRTDPVVIMLVTRGDSVLMGRSPGWPEGMYSLLAGFMEPGETIEAAVRREVFEETAVRCGAVGYLASQPWPFPGSLMIGCRAEALTEAITVDPVELEDAIWLTREAVLTVAAGQHPHLRPVRKGAIAGSLLQMWLAGMLD